MAVVALLDMLPQPLELPLPRPCSAASIPRTIMAQVNPYSIAVAPRVSRYNDARNDIMAPSSPDFRRWSCFSRIRLKNFFRGNLTLQNFSTPVFVVAVALVDGEGRVLLQ